MPKPLLTDETAQTIDLRRLDRKELDGWLAGQPERVVAWVRALDFSAARGSTCVVPDAKGGLDQVLVGASTAPDARANELHDGAVAAESLPPGTYRIADGVEHPELFAYGWSLSAYAFDRYRSATPPGEGRRLVTPEGCDAARVAATVDAVSLCRELVSTPASDMGPAELADAAASLAKKHSASCETIVGEKLLATNFPMIHAVGRASDRAPRLIDLQWGRADAPKLTLVGKGVCFDTGGLDLKSASGMLIMKKDMGGAAHVLGLASLIMARALPVRLRVLIPAVENSVSGNAMRPLDVEPTRAGKTVEIGNTDAEGRLVLADALTEAASEQPAALIDFATLTGAARVALGAEVPALFSNDDELAAQMQVASAVVADPIWRMPLHQPYRCQLDSSVADLRNISDGPLGGAITAALFLQEFVDPVCPWAHIDVMAWNASTRPGRPEGGEAMGLRAVFAGLEQRFGGG